MKFNRQKFFAAYNRSFGELNQYQVDGLNQLLHLYETYYGWWDDIDQTSNALSQIKHESAHSFHPVVEGYYLAKNVPLDENYYHGNYPVVKNFQKKLKYFPYFGMGHIQLTWLDNFQRHEKLLKQYFPEIVTEFEATHAEKLDFVNKPRQVLDFKISFAIMTIGMHRGTFRGGRKLDDYKTGKGFDHFNARSIVNGDKFYDVKNSNLNVGEKIAADAVLFAKILRGSLVSENAFADLNDDEIELDIPQTDSAQNSDAVNLPVNINTGSEVGTEPVKNNADNTTAQNQPPTSESEPNLGILQSSEPQGDSPETPPRTWLNVEDWKPWVFSKLKLIWGGFSGTNLTQFAGNTFAAVNAGENWWLFVLVAIGILVISLIICAVISLILLAIWYFNRKEIKEYIMLSKKSLLDPNSANLGLQFEKIGSAASRDWKASSDEERVEFQKYLQWKEDKQ